MRTSTAKRGIALLMVLILMLLLALIVAAALYLTQSHFELLQEQVRRQQAFYAAEAGMQHALVLLRTGQGATIPPIPASPGPPWLEVPVPGSYTAHVQATQLGVNQAGPFWEVRSSATYQ